MLVNTFIRLFKDMDIYCSKLLLSYIILHAFIYAMKLITMLMLMQCQRRCRLFLAVHSAHPQTSSASLHARLRLKIKPDCFG
jgi:hypothetical protein